MVISPLSLSVEVAKALRTRLGPHSMKVRTPSEYIRSSCLMNSTGLVICLMSMS